MAEMIIPGTYVDVRAEGLISARGVATGILGVIGTARSGPIGVAQTLSSLSNARDIFGRADDYAVPDDGSNPLTLMRALQLAYNNGASSVVAVRVASPRRASASYELKDGTGNTVAKLIASTPGRWGNDIQISVDDAKTPARIVGEKHTSSFAALNYKAVVPNPQNRIQVTRGDTRRVDIFNLVYKLVVTDETVQKNSGGTYQLGNPKVAQVASINSIRVLDANGKPVRAYGANPPTGVTAGTIIYNVANTPALNEVRINPATGELAFEATQVPASGQSVVATYAVDHDDPKPGEALITTWNGNIDFRTGEGPRAAASDVLTANYLVAAGDAVQVTLTWGQVKESYVVPDGNSLAAQAAGSSLITILADPTNGKAKPATGVLSYFGTGSNTGGADGADAGKDEYAAGLEAISNMLVNIVVLAGQDTKSMGSVLVGHLNATQETDHERIGVIGAPGSTIADFLGHTLASDRVIVVAPGIRYPDDGSDAPAGLHRGRRRGLHLHRLGADQPHQQVDQHPGHHRVGQSRPAGAADRAQRADHHRQGRLPGAQGSHHARRRAALCGDPDPPHRRLRQVRRAFGREPLYRPTQQFARARGAQGHARRIPDRNGRRRSTHRIRARRDRHPRAGNRRPGERRHDAPADLQHRLHPRRHDAAVRRENTSCPTMSCAALMPFWCSASRTPPPPKAERPRLWCRSMICPTWSAG